MTFFSFGLVDAVLALVSALGFVSVDLVATIFALVSTLESFTFGLVVTVLALVSVLAFVSVDLTTAFFGASLVPPVSAISIILRSVRSCL